MADRRLDEILLVLSLIGVFLFRVFSSIAGHFTADETLVTAVNVIIIIQVIYFSAFAGTKHLKAAAFDDLYFVFAGVV